VRRNTALGGKPESFSGYSKAFDQCCKKKNDLFGKKCDFRCAEKLIQILKLRLYTLKNKQVYTLKNYIHLCSFERKEFI